MRIVVDSNILFASLITNGETRRLVFLNKLELVTPEFFREELNKYKPVLQEKAGFRAEELEKAVEILLEKVKVVNATEYLKDKVSALETSPDENDWPFFALALHYDIPIWSQDARLKQQDKVKVLNTKELIEQLK